MNQHEQVPLPRVEDSGQPPKLHFKNELRLSEFEADQKFNERRLRLAPQLKKLIETSPTFGGEEISVEYAHTGVSSLVCFVTAEANNYVLKVPLSLTDGGDSEAEFLRRWEGVGVAVPHVYESGFLEEHPYTLMQYVDAPPLSQAVEEGTAKATVHVDMGKTLAAMHTTKAEGYGRLVEGSPQHTSFKEWLLSEEIAKRVRKVQENHLLGDEHGPIDRVFDALLAYTDRNPQSTYCHFDFSVANILATDPLTVFDPSPMLNSGIIDIGRSVLSTVFQGQPNWGEQLKEGYFGQGAEYDAKALQASIVLNAYWKLPYQHKKGLTKKIEAARDYLAERSSIL